MKKINLLIILILIIIITCKNLNNLDFLKNIPIINNLFFNNTIDNKEIEDEDDEDLSVSEDTQNIVNNLHSKILSPNINIYIDILIDNKNHGRLVFELFNNIVPTTCNNFIDLCKNKAYNDNKFHRLIKDFCIQGGDITNNDGSGGISIYGNTFDDENFDIKHDDIGILSMANKGPNTNNSQFFITFKATPWLDGKHVAFGKIKSGLNLLKNFNNLKYDNDKPINNIVISDCGLI